MTAHQKRLAQELIPFLDTLTLRQRDIIERRYGLLDGTTHTLEDIGAEFALSPNRGRQIEATALAVLRRRWDKAQKTSCGYCKDCRYWDGSGGPGRACWRKEESGAGAWIECDATVPEEGSYIVTLPDFGCIQFKPKPTEVEPVGR